MEPSRRPTGSAPRSQFRISALAPAHGPTGKQIYGIRYGAPVVPDPSTGSIPGTWVRLSRCRREVVPRAGYGGPGRASLRAGKPVSGFSRRSSSTRCWSWPSSGGKAVNWLSDRFSSVRRWSWPSSGGSAVTWLSDRSSFLRFESWPISGGSAFYWLPPRTSSARPVSWPARGAGGHLVVRQVQLSQV